MKSKPITINGKQVTLAYCFATEINFGMFTEGQSASAFIPEMALQLKALSEGDSTAVPDIKKCIYLVLSAAIAYYKSVGEDCPITADDIMFTDNSGELYEALGQVIILYGEFYKLLPSEQPKQKEGSKGKN